MNVRSCMVKSAKGFVSIAVGGAFSAGLGAVYAKLADLPVAAVAKTHAIWMAAQLSLQMIASAFTDNIRYKAIICSVIDVLTTVVGIQQLILRGLIGKKLIIFITVFKILLCAIAVLLFLKGMEEYLLPIPVKLCV